METGSSSTSWYWPQSIALASRCGYFCGQMKILINNEQGLEIWFSIAFLWKSSGCWNHFVMISLSENPKLERKIILEFSMMKMERTLPAFVTKCFTITSYYFSCHSLQIFLMTEQFLFFLQGWCTDIRCCIPFTEKKIQVSTEKWIKAISTYLSSGTHTT